MPAERAFDRGAVFAFGKREYRVGDGVAEQVLARHLAQGKRVARRARQLGGDGGEVTALLQHVVGAAGGRLAGQDDLLERARRRRQELGLTVIVLGLDLFVGNRGLAEDVLRRDMDEAQPAVFGCGEQAGVVAMKRRQRDPVRFANVACRFAADDEILGDAALFAVAVKRIEQHLRHVGGTRNAAEELRAPEAVAQPRDVLRLAQLIRRQRRGEEVGIEVAIDVLEGWCRLDLFEDHGVADHEAETGAFEVVKNAREQRLDRAVEHA